MLKYIQLLLIPLGLFAVANPSNLILTPTINSVTLSWQDNANDETGYRIFRNSRFIKFLPANSTSYTDSGLTSNTRYTYTVVATDASINMGDWKRTNPGAGGTINMIGATADRTLVLASDLSGVYVKLEGSDRWRVKGEVNGLKNTHISALGFHPTNGKIFYVGTGSGLYKTINHGDDFEFIDKLTFNDYNDTYVESVVVSKSNPNIIYVTYHSWDNNQPSHIDKINFATNQTKDVSIIDTDRLRIVKLLIHPKDPNLIYAISGKPRWGCSPARAYVSKNGGENWQMLDNVGDVMDVDVDPLQKNVVYLSTFHAKSCMNDEGKYEDIPMEDYVLDNGAGKLFKSNNYGLNGSLQKVLDQGGTISASTTNSNDVRLINILTSQHAYWMEDEDNKPTGTWISSKGGKKDSWTNVDNVYQNWKDGYTLNDYQVLGYAFNGLNKTLTKDIFDYKKLYASNGWTMITTDGGEHFRSLSTKKVATNRWISTGIENINGFALDVNKNDNKVIYMGGYDIGLWVSRDRGASWKWQYPYKWHSLADDDKLMLLNRYSWGAVQSTPEYDSPKQYHLRDIGGSNVMTLLSDPSDASKVWSSFARSQTFAEAEVNSTNPEYSDRSGMFRSTDYGDSWSVSNIYKKDGTLLNPYRHIRLYGLSIDESTHYLYLTVDGDLARSTDDGVSWHIIQKNGGLKFTAASNAVVYAGGESGLWRLKNSVFSKIGGDFEQEMMGVGSPMFKDFAPQENKTADNDESIILKYAWNGVSGIAIDPNRVDTVYVTIYSPYDKKNPNLNQKGVYRTDDGGEHWSRISLGNLENRYLRSVQVHPDNSNIIFVTSSQSINSGGEAGSSKGIIYSTDRGASWQEANNGMAWKFATALKIDSIGKRIWAWGAGTGIQYVDLLP